MGIAYGGNDSIYLRVGKKKMRQKCYECQIDNLIRARAKYNYEWRELHFAEGSELEDWLNAEREVMEEIFNNKKKEFFCIIDNFLHNEHLSLTETLRNYIEFSGEMPLTTEVAKKILQGLNKLKTEIYELVEKEGEK